MADQFIEEHYGDLDFRTAEEVAALVAEAEAVEYMEWEVAAAASDAYRMGYVKAQIDIERTLNTQRDLITDALYAPVFKVSK